MKNRTANALESYERALQRHAEDIALSQKRKLSIIEEQGLIKSFEFTYEMAINLMRRIFEEEGTEHVIGAKSAIRKALRDGIIRDGKTWMKMVKFRNLVAHTYEKKVAVNVAATTSSFTNVFKDLILTCQEVMRK